MKLIEIANRIDKSSRNEDWVDITKFDTEFNCTFEYIEQNRLKCYHIGNWLCTDSWVGRRMYFLDDEPVAISTQIGRKYDQEFEWFSEEKALKVRDYLLSLMKENEEDLQLKFCDINDDIGDSFKIEFNCQILNPDKAIYKGKPIKILERIKETPDYGIDKKLKVKLSSGEETILNIKDIDFKFNII
jgi:hypothetical protein